VQNTLSTAIKVRCTVCHSQSEVSGVALGHQAKCPFCESIFEVSELGGDEEVRPVLDPAARHPLELGKLDPAKAFRLALEIVKANLSIVFVTHIMFLSASVVVQASTEAAMQAGISGVAPLVQVAGIVAVIWLSVGLTNVTLQLARGVPTPVETLFSGRNCLIRVAIFNVVFVIIVGIGCVAFIVPGIYLMLRFWSGSYFIIDRDCNVSEAFQLASTFSEWNKVSSLQLACLSFGMAVLGLSFFGVGFILVYPLINLMWTIAYMMMTRQPIQRPVAETS